MYFILGSFVWRAKFINAVVERLLSLRKLVSDFNNIPIQTPILVFEVILAGLLYAFR